ncbi:catechol 2,3-dioxygenase-like lactoylglutathione lyase family enzyme [Catenulispora sp. MAP5-51]|uniref:glyoxalase n=1 Tax=Catenulispora sp. MAP5-51 TaxID=3156298 RepID=UPI0035127854
MLSSLHHTQVAVPKGAEDISRAYYVGVLGMTELPKPPVLAARGGCWFAAGGLEIHTGVEEPFVPARKAHPGILVTDIDELSAALTAAGHEYTWDTSIPDRRRLHTFDPHGNRLEFIQE